MKSRNETRKSKALSVACARALRVLACGAAAQGLLVAPAAARDPGGSLEEITVTGSRMRGVEAPVGSAVISLDQKFIADSPSVSTDQLIREIPQAYNLGVSEASRGQPGGNGNIVYGNAANIRGIGPFATLVLVDGHRVVTNSRNVEPSLLPTLALERVDVVADGASAVYGSDAIAGVLNLVQRRYVDGGRIVARYGSGSGFDERLIGASWGMSGEKGQLFLAYENNYRSALNGSDRDYFRALQPAADYRSPLCNPGNIVVGGVSYAIPAGGVTPATAGSLVPDTRNLCETLANQDLVPEQENNAFSFTSNYKVTDSTEVFLDGFISRRNFKREFQDTTGSLVVPSTNAFFVSPVGTTPSNVTVQYNFSDDFQSDDAKGHVSRWGLTTGLKQKLPGDWTFDALVTYGENNEVSKTYRGVNAAALAAALASSDPNTALDVFGLNRTNPAVRAGIGNQIFLVDSDVEFLGAEASVGGPVLDLPGGALQVALGYERQDLESLPTLARGNPGTPYSCVPCTLAGVSSLKRDVNSFYGEVLVPVVGQDNAVTGIRSLDLRGAIRYDDYSDVGSTDNLQFGLTWGLTDGLKLRASYAEAFRAPQFSDLFGNSAGMFVEAFVDPTTGGAPRQGVFQSGGNPALSPETAETLSFGLDWDIEALPGTSLSLTYFDVTYENQIAQYLGDRNILLREGEFSGTGIILRGDAAQARIDELFAQGLTVARGVLPVPVTLYVDGRPNNLGVSETQGVDFLLRRGWSTDGGHQFVADLNGVYTLDYKVAITPNGTLIDRDNQIFNPLRLRARASLGWSRDEWSARVVVNHVGSYDNTLASPVQKVDSFSPVDLQAWWRIGDQDGTGLNSGWRLGLQLTNAFDEEPPYVNLAPSGNGGGGYDPSAASPIGRVWGISLEKSF